MPVVPLPRVGYAVQLGKAFSSNNSGDGPDEDETTRSCFSCSRPAPILQRACDRCYDVGVYFPQKECAVCHVQTEARSRRQYTEPQAKQAKEFIDSSEGSDVFEALRACRDLRRWPLRPGEFLCRQNNCLSRQVESFLRRKKKAKRPLSPRGPRPLAPCNDNERCSACNVAYKKGEDRKLIGKRTESMNAFFHEVHDKTRDKENRAPLSPTSKVCLDCHRAWDRHVTSLKRRRKATGNVQHTGSNAFFVQQTVEENRINVLKANLDTLESDSKDYAELSKERVLANFRRHILSECLSGCQPTTKDELCAVLEQMVKRDPVGSKMAIVEDFIVHP